MDQPIAIAVSGGVDSLAAAYLLKNRGYNVLGIHFVTGHTRRFDDEHPGPSASRHINLIENQLDIPVHLIDCTDLFYDHVIRYFIDGYRNGSTPNPCMRCNPLIKFGAVLSYARELGALTLATGHYARVIKDPDGTVHLYKGLDPLKDQSYFLALLTREQLSSACFPLGNMTKENVRSLAREKNLQPLFDKESRDICFIKDQTYREFLENQPGFQPTPGPIEDCEGNPLGRHNGLHRFTIGQRRGINRPGPKPYYVVRMDKDDNRLIIGTKKDLETDACRVSRINWIQQRPSSPVSVNTRIRYRSPEIPSLLVPLDDDKAVIRFKQARTAIAPGQSAVFYRHDEVVGGGLIDGPGDQTGA